MLISQPLGFSHDLTNVKVQFSDADRILVPWPEAIFRWPDELAPYLAKVLRIDPILSIPLGGVRRNPQPGMIYAAVGRDRPVFEPWLRSAVEIARQQDSRVSLILQEDLAARAAHVERVLSADLLVSQGTTMVFEALALGIPRIHVPNPEASEQLTLANMLEQRGAVASKRVDRDSADVLSEELLQLLFDREARERQVAAGQGIVEGSGVDRAARAILELAGRP